MITLDAIRALHEHDHKLAADCPTCERWAVLDLERLIAAGRGENCFVGRKPRCRRRTALFGGKPFEFVRQRPRAGV